MLFRFIPKAGKASGCSEHPAVWGKIMILQMVDSSKWVRYSPCMNFTRHWLISSVTCCVVSVQAGNWPAWHGPKSSGVTPETNLPIRWSATENVRWKVALPDRGNSSPVIWGDRVFITQAIEKENRITLMCFNRADGKILWQSGTTYAEKDPTHDTNPYGSASPVTDGERVIAWFGSAGVYCYDLNGKELWHRNLGKQNHRWGYASSPIIDGDLCFLNFGPGERTFLIALNKMTGKPVWQIDVPPVQPKERTDGFAGQKDGVIGSWSTPIMINANGRDELIMSFPGQVRAFEPKTGKELWVCDGLNPLVYSSPIYGEGVVLGMGGFQGTQIAVKPGGNGNVTDSHRLWKRERNKNQLGCGVIYDGHFYVLDMPGIAECINLKTGKQVWEERVSGLGPKSESWSSMRLAGDKIYVLNQSGDTLILRASPKFEIIGVNSIGNELTNSSLAVSDGELFIRTHLNLWCIGAGRPKATAAKATSVN
jgi:outer membrane protein assembly factor BamB